MKCHLTLKLLPCIWGLLTSPLTLADDLLEIYNRALEQDPTLGEARARYGANHTLLAQERAGLLPTLNVSGFTTRSAQGLENPPPDRPQFGWSYGAGYNTHSYSVNLQQNVVNMQEWYGWQAARDGDRRAMATLTQAEQALIVRVATAYFDVLRSIETLAAFTAEEAAAATLLEQTQLRFDAGLVAITDVNEAQASHDLSRVGRLGEERNLNSKRLALEAITGSQHGELEGLRADFPVTPPEPAQPDAWVELARANSPELKAAEHDFAARSDEARAARSAHLPRLTLGAIYNDSAEQSNSFNVNEIGAQRRAELRLTLTIPIFNGGADSARKRQAYYNRDASEQVLLGTKRNNERDVRDNYLGVELGVATVAARQQALNSAQTALGAIQAGMEAGLRNVVDVGNAQRTLYQTLRDYANARYDYVLDTLALKQTAGVVTPQDVIDLNQWLQ